MLSPNIAATSAPVHAKSASDAKIDLGIVIVRSAQPHKLALVAIIANTAVHASVEAVTAVPAVADPVALAAAAVAVIATAALAFARFTLIYYNVPASAALNAALVAGCRRWSRWGLGGCSEPHELSLFTCGSGGERLGGCHSDRTHAIRQESQRGCALTWPAVRK